MIMTERNRDYLKQEFKDGERPSGTDFADLIDSFVNKSNDGLTLDVDGNLQLARGVRLGDSLGTAAGTLRFNGGKVQFHNGTAWVDIASGAGGAFQPVGGSTAVAYTTGNVGIGAFAIPPTYRLEVDLGSNTGEGERVRFGNAVCSNGLASNQGYACFSHRNHSSNTNYALRQGPNGNVHINAAASQPVSIRQNGTDVRLSVSAAGHVVIGSESDLSGAGAAVLQVAGEAFKSSGTSAWTIPSDARLKEDIRDLELGLQHLVQVRPVRFRYNGKAGTSSGSEGVGIIGQEMEKIFPDMVQHVKNPNPGELNDDDMLVYNASALTYVLVNAVKELAGKVQRLEAALALASNDASVSAPDSP
jgi:hypothetical protein